jgi:hypothetical protein
MRYFLGILNLAASTIIGAGAFVAGMGCDESCSYAPDDWSESPFSWQWTAIPFLGLALFTLAVLILFFAGARWVGATAILFAGQVAAWLLFFSLASGAESLNLFLPLILATGQLALGGTTVLSTRTARANAEPLT